MDCQFHRFRYTRDRAGNPITWCRNKVGHRDHSTTTCVGSGCGLDLDRDSLRNLASLVRLSPVYTCLLISWIECLTKMLAWLGMSKESWCLRDDNWVSMILDWRSALVMCSFKRSRLVLRRRRSVLLQNIRSLWSLGVWCNVKPLRTNLEL